MLVYLVTREGVYNAGIVGVFSSKELADLAAAQAASLEVDNYHSFNVTAFNVDEILELEVYTNYAELKRRI